MIRAAVARIPRTAFKPFLLVLFVERLHDGTLHTAVHPRTVAKRAVPAVSIAKVANRRQLPQVLQPEQADFSCQFKKNTVQVE